MFSEKESIRKFFSLTHEGDEYTFEKDYLVLYAPGSDLSKQFNWEDLKEKSRYRLRDGQNLFEEESFSWEEINSESFVFSLLEKLSISIYGIQNRIVELIKEAPLVETPTGYFHVIGNPPSPFQNSSATFLCPEGKIFATLPDAKTGEYLTSHLYIKKEDYDKFNTEKNS